MKTDWGIVFIVYATYGVSGYQRKHFKHLKKVMWTQQHLHNVCSSFAHKLCSSVGWYTTVFVLKRVPKTHTHTRVRTKWFRVNHSLKRACTSPADHQLLIHIDSKSYLRMYTKDKWMRGVWFVNWLRIQITIVDNFFIHVVAHHSCVLSLVLPSRSLFRFGVPC